MATWVSKDKSKSYYGKKVTVKGGKIVPVSGSSSDTKSSISKSKSSGSSSYSSSPLKSSKTSEEQKLVSQGFTPEYKNGKVRYVKGSAHTAWRSSGEWEKASEEATKIQPKKVSSTSKSKLIGTTSSTDYIAKGYEAKTGKQVQPSWVKKSISKTSEEKYVPPSPEMELLFPGTAKGMKYKYIVEKGVESYKKPKPSEEASWKIEKKRDIFLTSESKKAKVVRAARAVTSVGASLFWESLPVAGPLEPVYQWEKGAGRRKIIKAGEKQIQAEIEQKKLLKSKAEKEIKTKESIITSELDQRKREYQKEIQLSAQNYADKRANEIYAKKGELTEQDIKKIQAEAENKVKPLIEKYNKKLQTETKIKYQTEVNPIVKKYNIELSKSKATAKLNKALKRYDLATQFVETPIKVFETMLIPGAAGVAVGGMYTAQIGTHPIETVRSIKEHPGLAAVTIGSAVIGAKLAKPIKAEYHGMRMRSDLAKGSKYSNQALKISTKKAGKLEVSGYGARVSESIIGKKYAWKVKSVGKGVRLGKGSKSIIKGHQGYVAKLTKKGFLGKEKKLYVETGEPTFAQRPSRIGLGKGKIEKGIMNLKTTEIIPSKGRILGRKPKISVSFKTEPYISRSKPSGFFKSELYGKKPTKITYETIIGGKKPTKTTGELRLINYVEIAKKKVIPGEKIMVSRPARTTTGEPFIISKVLTRKPKRIVGGISSEIWTSRKAFEKSKITRASVTQTSPLNNLKSTKIKPSIAGKSTKAVQISKTKTLPKVKPSLATLKDITKQFGKTKALAKLGKSRMNLAITKISKSLVKPTGLRTVGSLAEIKKPRIGTKYKEKGLSNLAIKTKPKTEIGTKQFGVEMTKLRVNQELFQPTKIKTGVKTPEIIGTKIKLRTLTMEEVKLNEVVTTPPTTMIPTVSPIIRTPPTLFPFLTPPTGLLFGSRGFGAGSKKMKTRYTANIAGIFSGKFLKKAPKKKTYTGLEVRYPVLPKGTWKI